jgi:formate dehydrogenase (coenzyme F420) beta subunit
MNGTLLLHMRKVIKEAFAKRTISCFLGFTPVDGMPMTMRPFLAKEPKDVDLLDFSSFSRVNLARYTGGKTNYIPKLAEGQKMGIMLKGCDSRSILANIAESKLDREKLWIFGIVCSGTVNIDRLREACPCDIKAVEENGNRLILTLIDGQTVYFDKKDFLDTKCIHCKYPTPIEADHFLVSDSSGKQPYKNGLDWVQKYMEKPFSERRDFIINHLSRCTMCYACRDACPGCYCNENCVMDYPKLTEPYLHKEVNLKNILMYHFIHYFHLSDRCTGCGECTRACPENIPLNLITDQLQYLTETTWNFESGTNDISKAPLSLYRIEEVLGR